MYFPPLLPSLLPLQLHLPLSGYSSDEDAVCVAGAQGGLAIVRQGSTTYMYVQESCACGYDKKEMSGPRCSEETSRNFVASLPENHISM